MSDEKNMFGEDDEFQSGDFQFDSETSNEYEGGGFGTVESSAFEVPEDESFESGFQDIPDDPFAAPSEDIDPEIESMMGADPDQLQDEEFIYGQEQQGEVYDQDTESFGEGGYGHQEVPGQNNPHPQNAIQEPEKKKAGVGKIVGFACLGAFALASAGMTGYLVLGGDGESTAPPSYAQAPQQQMQAAQVNAAPTMVSPALSPLPDAVGVINEPQVTQPEQVAVTPDVIAEQMQLPTNDPFAGMEMSEPEPSTAILPPSNSDLGGGLASLEGLIYKQHERINAVTAKVENVSSEVSALKGQIASLESKITKLANSNKASNKPAATTKATTPSKSRATIAQSRKNAPKPAAKPAPKKEADLDRWYVRGVTAERAIIYRAKDGLAYTVSLGKEVPGFGAVTKLRPDLHEVHTAKGIIKRKAAG